MPKAKNSEIASICWDCIHSVPNTEGTHGCSWSRSFEPVKGWKAKSKTNISAKSLKLRHHKTYIVLKCPQFEKDE